MKLLAVFLLVFSMMALTSGLRFKICRRPYWFPFYKPCPRGWTKIYGRCFRYVARPMTWANAEKNCLSMGANLASVRNAYEYRRIQALIRAASRNSREAWLGGSDAQQEKTWLWSDGSPMRYTNWCPGEPNNGGGSQHCLQMNYSGGKCWDDLWCNHSRPSVCAKRLRRR
ncbi:PREDICTED: galactose-specific lectin nattectin-like [Poecilia mexicana]|nr:PREDICTED: galactose-specific lectin nattectin-like [Poecilia mexicana]XP_014831468.1 PREDICTED: galactose-specific lectin nattectin-like [Poecilia mexicana]XP_014831469.1 PREDICTED: galactose-specific lectin nattectin-like [Poecilia mexicana]